ncbi:response regulator [Vibrio campbellii]
MYRNVLIVDDVQLSREVMKNSIENIDDRIKVSCVESAFSAISYLRNKSYDIIIMDIMMPDGNGYELLNLMSHMSITAKLIIVSSIDKRIMDYIEWIGKLYELDIVKTIEKPIESRLLADLVSNLLTENVEVEQKLINANIINFPFVLYYQRQVTCDEGKYGLDVSTKLYNDANVSTLISQLEPDQRILSKSQYYGKIFMESFLKDYYDVFAKLDDNISFQLQLSPAVLKDDDIFNIFYDIVKYNKNHKFNFYLDDLGDLNTIDFNNFRVISEVVGKKIGVILKSDFISVSGIKKLLDYNLKGVHYIPLVTEELSKSNDLYDNDFFYELASLCKIHDFDVILDGVDDDEIYQFLNSKGLFYQQGLLHGVPTTAVNVKEQLSSLSFD